LVGRSVYHVASVTSDMCINLQEMMLYSGWDRYRICFCWYVL